MTVYTQASIKDQVQLFGLGGFHSDPSMWLSEKVGILFRSKAEFCDLFGTCEYLAFPFRLLVRKRAMRMNTRMMKLIPILSSMAMFLLTIS
jgi:hypothetical protein